MTPRERVLAAMNMKQPDRVPVMCQFSIGFMNQQLKETDITPMELWYDADRYAEALLWLRNRFDFDGILVSIHGHYPDWREKILKLQSDGGVETVTFEDRVERFVEDDLLVGTFFKPREKPLEDVDPDSIPEVLDYIPASKGCYIFIDRRDPYRIFDILEEHTGGMYSLHGEVTSPLDYLLDLLGYENGLLAMITEPEKVGRIMEKFTAGVVRMTREMAAHKSVDAIKVSSPFAGMGFISPEFYRQFELPYLTRVADAIRESGKTGYLHTCGHIHDRLEIMAESGIPGLECLDPPPIGNVKLDDAFRRIGDKMFIKGNIDSVNTLLEGTDESIRADVGEIMRIGMANKGFILSTACSISPRVPKENIQLLARIAEESGYYR